MCPRTNRNGLDEKPFIKNQEITFDIIQKAFANITPAAVHFCGNVGDPMMAHDLYSIVEYFINKGSTVSIATNGSTRSEDWWEKLGRLGKGLVVYFGIDGITQSQHEQYRRNTNLQKILNNAMAFNLAGGRSVWQWISFRHNFNDVEHAKQLAKQYGFADFNFVNTGWFKTENVFEYTYKDQTHTLYPSPLLVKPIFPSSKQIDQCTDVNCFAEARNEMFISSNGDMWPCCMTASYNITKVDPTRPNIYKETIDKVLDGNYFNNFKQTRTTTPELACRVTCGLNYGNEREQQSLT
jgi:hypothetical protein